MDLAWLKLFWMQLSKATWIARRRVAAGVDEKKVHDLIEARNEARKSRNFTEADRIRAELRVMRVLVKDNKDGTTSWEVAP